MKLVRATIESIVVERPKPSEEQPQGMCLDKGYAYAEVRGILAEFGFTAHIRSRSEEAKELAREEGDRLPLYVVEDLGAQVEDQALADARGRVVERSHSWMNRFRRILVRWEKKPDHYLAFLHFACALIAFRSAELFG